MRVRPKRGERVRSQILPLETASTGVGKGWNCRLHEGFYVRTTKEAVRYKNGFKR